MHVTVESPLQSVDHMRHDVAGSYVSHSLLKQGSPAIDDRTSIEHRCCCLSHSESVIADSLVNAQVSVLNMLLLGVILSEFTTAVSSRETRKLVLSYCKRKPLTSV